MRLEDFKDSLLDTFATVIALIVCVVPIAVGVLLFSWLSPTELWQVVASAIVAILSAVGVFLLEIVTLIKTL